MGEEWGGGGGTRVRALREPVFTLQLSLSLPPSLPLSLSVSGVKAVFRTAEFAFAAVKDN